VNYSLTTCESQDSERRSQLIRQWAVRFASNCGKALSDDLVALWQDELSDLPFDVLEAAFRKTMQTCRFWPTVADIRSHVQQADSTVADAEAERAWDKVLEYAVRFGNVSSNSIPPITNQAMAAGLRAVGGKDFLEAASDEQRLWARKLFLEIYQRQRSLPEVAQLCSQKDSPALREAIDALAQKKALT
jgi:nucleotide-binding universal stress UspA family protein